MKLFEWLASFIAWLQIVASPLIFGLIIGFVIYKKYPSKIGFIAGICVSILSLVIGIILATRIWKKRRTVDFISRVSASPEFDNLDNEEKWQKNIAIKK